MRFIYMIIWLVQIIILLIEYHTENVGYSEGHLKKLIVLVLINTILFLFYKKTVRHSKKSGLLSLVFLTGYLIVFFQSYVDLIYGNLTIDDVIFVNSNVIIKCCTISLCGLLAFFLGYTIKNKNRYKGKRKNNNLRVPNTIPLKLLLFSSLIFFFRYNYEAILLGAYSQEMLEEQAGTIGLYSNMLFQIFLFLYISYILSSFRTIINDNFWSYIKQIGFVVNLCIIFYIIFNMMIGDRGPIIIVCLAYYGGFLVSTRKDLSYIRLILLLTLSAIGITILGEMRRPDYDNMDNWTKLRNSLTELSSEQSSFSPYTEELAHSVNTLHYAVDYVPEKHEYLYGSFQLRQLCSAIPFMNHVVYAIANPHFKYKGSAFFVTWIIQGDNYSYGSGTSCNADLYLSFGVIGVVFGLLLWGYIYRVFEDKVDYDKIGNYGSIVFLYFLAYSFYVNRDSLLGFINLMIFTIIFKVIYDYFFIEKHNR